MSLAVLCIDDRHEILALRKHNLEALGYSVLTANNGVTGMKILKRIPVDVVLIEYKHEGMDAEAIAFHIKWLFPAVPIILLSAYSEMPERMLWLVDEYVMKSVRPDELARTIEKFTRSTPKKRVTSTSDIPTAATA